MAELIGELIGAIIEPLVWLIVEAIQFVGHLIGLVLEGLFEIAFGQSKAEEQKGP